MCHCPLRPVTESRPETAVQKKNRSIYHDSTPEVALVGMPTRDLHLGEIVEVTFFRGPLAGYA